VAGEAAISRSPSATPDAFSTDADRAPAHLPAPRATIWPTSRRTSRPCSAGQPISTFLSDQYRLYVSGGGRVRATAVLELLSTFAEA